MTTPKRRIMRRFRLDEISMVDQPAQAPALMTLMKSKSKKPITKKIGNRNFFVKDFAYVGDPTNPTTWKMRLTSKPNGKPSPVLVNAAIKQLGEQRYSIPDDAIDSILDKLREAWLKAFPSKNPDEMPPELNNEENKQEEDEEDNTEGEENNSEVPPSDENNNEGNNNEEDDNSEDDEDEKNRLAAKANEEDEDENSSEKEEDEDEEDLVDKILKGYIDTSEGARSFTDVVAEFKQQEEHFEMLDAAWPYISALDQSIRSIVADTEIETAAKLTMLRSSVEGFLAAIREVMPEVEEELVKVLSSTKMKGMPKMNKIDELSKKLEAAEKEREAAVAKAARLEAIAALTADEKEYFDRLKDIAKQDEFLALSKADRGAAIKKALAEDETVEIDGQVFSKSNTDPAVFAFIKSQAAKTAELTKKLEAEREKREEAELAKRVREEFANLPGTDEEKVELLKSLNGMPENARKCFETILKSAANTVNLSMTRLGVNGGGKPLHKGTDESHPFMKAVNEIRKRDNCSRTDAMQKARREFPEEFADWSGVTH